jgi:hypothetical protein
MSIRFSPVMLLAVCALALFDRILKGEKRLTSEYVDILAAVDTDQPFGNALFVPVSANTNQRPDACCEWNQTYLTVSDILDESENSDSVGLAYAPLELLRKAGEVF